MFSEEDLFNSMKPIKEEKKVVNKDTCVKCFSNNLRIKDGLNICNDCGLINDNVIDCNPEWRYYGGDDSKTRDPTRCGMPTNELLPESSCGSTVSFKYGESKEMRRIRNYHSWQAMPYKERSLYNVFDSIQLRSQNNGITSCIIQEAKLLYSVIASIKISRGYNRKGLIAACVYHACKLHNVPRSHKEIAQIFDINPKTMTKGCKKFDEIMNYSKSTKNTINMNGSKSVDFIQRFCSKLNLGKNIIGICMHVCKKAEEYEIVAENTPPSITAGTIFLVCNLLEINISKQQIRDVCEISEVTISKCYKKLLSFHKYLLPEEVLSKLY